jgi:hypothetical protein
VIEPFSQSFPDLSKPSVAYVDKTAQLVSLISEQQSYRRVFLARPRKWGKSVTVGTLDCVFRNKRELFKVRCCFCVCVCLVFFFVWVYLPVVAFSCCTC